MPSLYTLDAPPPVEPPVGVMELTAWSIAVQLWRDHQPDSLLRAECLQCRTAWPCATWQVADGIIADLTVTSKHATASQHAAAPGTPRHAERPEPPARRGPRPPRLVGAEGSTQELPRVVDRPFVGAYRRE
jgi:hypothetical protein